jgi:2,3-bisphosphoglycerate-independent phosphoglycerate mutase
MDGLAYAGPCDAAPRDDAVALAHTPVLDHLWRTQPHTQLAASGAAVGLPDGQMGNSEVGHLNIGAGRIVFQDLSRIDRSIQDGSFFENEVLLDAMRAARDEARTLHLMGLVSDGGVHSSNEHLYALLEMAKQVGATDVAVHVFLDGRDTPPQSGERFLEELEEALERTGVGRIATIAGRYWAMDRDRRWERIERAYRTLTEGRGRSYESAQEAIADAYERDESDEFVEPSIIDPMFSPIKEGDSVVFFNFRPDRARQITRAFIDDEFAGFDRVVRPRVRFVTLTGYDDTFEVPVAFPKEVLTDTLAEVLSANGLRQYRIAETEKYAHVTFFLSGGIEEPYAGEQRVLIPSPRIATYDLRPQMSAIEVADTLVEAIEAGLADIYIVNFANGDMVGHTGILDATVEAVETVDTQVGRIVAAMDERGGATLITADHGNAERMLDYDGVTPFTAHTSDPVPFIAVGTGARAVRGGALCDIAPTVLGLRGIDAPAQWTGTDLLVY